MLVLVLAGVVIGALFGAGVGLLKYLADPYNQLPALALVARAVAQEPRILVLDEPTASLDFGNQVRVLDAVRGLVERRRLSVLLSTHHPEQAFACADRVALLAGGELLRIGPPAAVITAETLRACYAVEVSVLPVADSRYRICVPRSYLA